MANDLLQVKKVENSFSDYSQQHKVMSKNLQLHFLPLKDGQISNVLTIQLWAMVVFKFYISTLFAFFLVRSAYWVCAAANQRQRYETECRIFEIQWTSIIKTPSQKML